MRLIDPIALKESIALSAIMRDGKSLEKIIDEQPTIHPELHCMTVKDMITRLRTKERVEVRDEQGYELFTCDTDSTIWFDYWDREITEWFPHPAPNKVCDFTVYIKDKEVTG